MQAIARARKQTWRSWRQRILKIFEAIRPDLEAYDARQEFRRPVLTIGAQMTNARKTTPMPG
jgi:hypothetical protein